MKINIHIECQDPEEAVEVFTRLSGGAKAEKAAPKKDAAKKEEPKAEPKAKAAKKEEPKAEPKAKAAPKKDAAKKEEPKAEVTKEELIVLGKQLCELTGGTQKALRSALDTVIEGEKISTCDASKYPAVKEAIEEAIAENNL